MKIKELLQIGYKSISKEHTEMLLASLLKINRLELLINQEEEVSINIEEYYAKLKKLKEGYPIQYVIGNVNFYGNTFIVNENVLIPRFETEELVENTLHYINKYFQEDINIIDLGCGSGAIGLTLKDKLPKDNITLLDISSKALEVAKNNANNLNLDVQFIESDMWNNVNEKYDVVISNPPYIKNDEEIEDIVKNNEPHLALYGGIDGLDCYRKIKDKLLLHTKERFLLALEIGDTQKDDVINLFNDLPNTKIISKKDLEGRDRMIFILNNIE